MPRFRFKLFFHIIFDIYGLKFLKHRKSKAIIRTNSKKKYTTTLL
mgnify:CR=1 FL=1